MLSFRMRLEVAACFPAIVDCQWGRYLEVNDCVLAHVLEADILYR